MDPLTPSELASLRSRFSRVLERDDIYLANHSLGRPLDCMLDDLQEFAGHWYRDLDEAWEAWMSRIHEFQTLIANLLGSDRPDCVVPKSSAGQGLRAVLNSFNENTHRAIKIVSTEGEFDSVDFILRSYQDAGRIDVDWISATAMDGVDSYSPESIIRAINRDTDLVVLSYVHFTTGRIQQGLADIWQACQEHQARLLVDIYHAFGVFPIDIQADFLIGGSYKYVHGGPGACWLWVNPSIADDASICTLDTGWFAKEDPFEFTPHGTSRASGGQGWWESTPSIAPIYQAISGLQLINELGIPKIRATSLQMQRELRAEMKEAGVPIYLPEDDTAFGGFSILPSKEADRLVQELKRLKVTVDARGGFVRFGPDILNNSEEFQEAAKRTAQVLSGGKA